MPYGEIPKIKIINSKKYSPRTELNKNALVLFQELGHFSIFSKLDFVHPTMGIRYPIIPNII